MATLDQLARLVGAQVVGDGRIEISRIRTIDQAGTGDLTFLTNPKYLPYLEKCQASAVIMAPGTEAPGKNLLVCPNPYLAFAKILTELRGEAYPYVGILPGAVVAPSAKIGQNVSIYPGCVVGDNVVIGDNCMIFPNVVIYADVRIGSDCLIHAGCLIREQTQIGNRVILQPGAILGSDGFGFAPDGEAYFKIPQVGIVVLEDDVELGSCCCIDRAALGETRIKKGCKIDNMVHVAHNVEIGGDSVIAAQTGIAGSSRIGRHATFGGQSAVSGHVTLGDNITLAGKGGAAQNLDGNQIYSGTPAIPHKQWLKSSLVFGRLPEMRREISALQKRLLELEDQIKELNR
ncbi:UDP-3-O-(3-hydroxymyristoyl)glucosamine N-acyltransferase [Geopsychrobacter electrodiphilus]|uniref:UDP-3-O-(3-hydroxymyristoyl)glucosamine N-acyltransferase n=1 Tax=Geopsychrobacter electrodiphilus TaxID=225196 RepID=UPI000365A75D|nr:UDP-3-O-(3-hydroxymyristoyl)glucosamine N-acyltransferase [Geopsychrobacter electrodiphilus]